MNHRLPAESSELPLSEEKLLSRAEHRMAFGMLVLGVATTAFCWILAGWRWALSFAIGAILSALNFHWVKTTADSLADLATAPATPRKARSVRPGRLVVRLVLRYALIGLAGYGILKSPFFSLGAFFLGLFLFLGGILVEMTYEIYCAFRKA